jgi:hypothetical protein
MKILNTLNQILETKLTLLTKQLQESIEKDYKKEYELEVGRKFSDLIDRYPISDDELLSKAETVCKFNRITRITNIDNYLFENVRLTEPRRLTKWF